jgi:hypothetical protein
MEQRSSNYELLIAKLDQFTRKYYMNQLIRGVLQSLALILVLFLVMSMAEYWFYFGTGMRKFLFYSFIGVSVLALGVWVFIPLLHYFRLGKLISHEQAAQIIGQHFSNVEDRLLNILQLKSQANQTADNQLIVASIDQKSESIKLVPFKNAIDLNKNRKYLRYALPPLLLLLVLLFAAPSLIKDSTARLIRNNEEFEKPAPFRFVIEEADLSVVQFDDYPLSVKIEGEVMPNEAYIEVDNYQYSLSKKEDGSFGFRFSNVQKDTRFRLFSSGVESREYELEVLKKPNILGFETQLDYPAYTQRKDEKLSSIGDLVVPVGTNIDWVFNAQNTDNIQIQFSGAEEKAETKRFSDELFTLKRRAMSDASYKLFLSNEDLPNADSISYTITVIPDQYPSIQVEKFQDSLNNKLLYFVGDASDDYGLLSLSFHYRIQDADGNQGKEEVLKIKKPSGKKEQYTHTWDLEALELKPGEGITYFFQVFDNDGVNGSKASRTNIMQYRMPTAEEFEEMEEENDQEIKDKLMKALEESRKIQQEMKEQREKLLQEKEMDWQNRKELEKLLERQKELQKEIEQAKQAFEENLKNQEEFSEKSEELMEKQEQLEKMFDEVMSDEMKELMKQIEELMQQLDKENALEMMEEFEMSDEEMEMELDRMLELFKQLELENELEKTIDELEELAEEQEELAKETEEEAKPQEELEKKQEEINEKFDDIQEKMDEIEKKNEELEKPKDLGDQDEQREDIEQDLNESQEQLEQQENKQASKKQKSAAQKMREMAQSMSMQMQSQAMDQMQEDMDALRQLLENLVGLSFDQEDLMEAFGDSDVNTPRYVDLVQEQFKLKDDFKLVEDSLQALSKRVFQIESFVTDKVMEVKGNMKQSLEDLEERRKVQASEHQQRVMKNVNDLALMLSEVMNQMQQQMSSMMSGSQMCNKPGGQGGNKGKVPQDKITEGQKDLNEQMKQAMQQMKDGQKKGGTGSKEFAEMAARQAALRKALREKQKELQQRGQGSKELQDIIDGMNKIETDLVNKRLTNEMLKRQEEILTRLLENERAEREREYENKRKSEVAKQYERKLPPSLEEYIRKREAEIELYRTVSPSLKPFYKNLVEEYFDSLEK